MEALAAYIPIDRREALARGRALPERTRGAALFGDISGFTPLTEMLARTLGPKRGAEELTKYLNHVFEALITELHRFGGSVIGFSGDAITCWFDGSAEDGAEAALLTPTLRATAAALAMQTAMLQFGDLDISSGGHVSLAMKAAVASGPVRRFVVGDPDYATLDVMAGKTLENLASAEHQANKGEVILDAAAAEALGDHISIADWRADEHTGERFAAINGLNVDPLALRRPWTPLGPDALSDDEARPWLIPAVYRLIKAGQGDYLAELRPAAALFLRFRGIDYDQDPDAPAKLDAFIRRVQNVLSRFDGSLIQLTVGDKGSYLYAAFGAPIAHEDDVDRAASVALEIQALPGQLAYLEPLQIGITWGRMRVGAYGAMTCRTYGVLGDATNLSARLMQASRPGQILASAEAQSRASDAFRWQEQPAIRVKGKSEPIRVHELRRGRRKQSDSAEDKRSLLPPIGRFDLIFALVQDLEALGGGRGQAVRIEGAAGMGKSHVLSHVLRLEAVQRARVAVGKCQSITRAAAYTPWRQIFLSLLDLEDTSETEAIASLARLLDAGPAGWSLRLPLLGDLLDLSIADNATTAAMDSTLRQASLFSLLVEMTQSWARTRPLALVIDNGQWMDEASQALTQALAVQACGTSPVLLMVCHRPAGPGEDALLPKLDDLPYASKHLLSEISDDDITALAERILSAPLDELLCGVTRLMARGNPFFVAELLGALRAGGHIAQSESGQWRVSDSLLDDLRRENVVVQSGGEWRLKPGTDPAALKLGIPDSIHGLILSRLDRLPEACKLTLKVSSVVGHTGDLALVWRAHPEKKELEQIRREVALMEQERILRRDAPDDGRYAFRDHSTQEVAYDTLLFAQRQQLHGAVARALAAQHPDANGPMAVQIAYHAYAGEAWPLSLRFSLLAGADAKGLHATQQAIDFLKKALHSAENLKEADTLTERKQIHLALGELYDALGQYDGAVKQLDTALALARAQADGVTEAMACRWQARVREQKSEYPQALEWLEAGFAALRGTTSIEEAELCLLSGLVQIRLGQYDAAIRQCERSLRVAEKLGSVSVRARTFNLLGMIELRSSSGGAIDRSLEALRQYEATGDVFGQATSHNLVANGYFARGDLAQADFHYRKALDSFTQIGHVYFQVLVNNNLGGIAIKLERWDAALGYYQRALRQLEQIRGSLWVFGALRLNIGNARMQQNQLDEAAIDLAESLAYFERAQVRDLLPELYGLFAELKWRQDALEEAQRFASQSIALAQELKMPREEGHNQRIAGEIALAQGRPAEAKTHFARSIQMLTEDGDAFEAAKAQLGLARLLIDQDEKGEAQALLGAAMAVVAGHDAPETLALGRRLLAESGER